MLLRGSTLVKIARFAGAARGAIAPDVTLGAPARYRKGINALLDNQLPQADHIRMEAIRPQQAAPQAPPPKEPRRGGGWRQTLFIAFVSPIISGFILVIVVLVFASVYGGGVGEPTVGRDEEPALTEVWSCGSGSNLVARIPIKGLLVEDDNGGLFSKRGPIFLALRQIRAASVNTRIKAIILEIDSPGGSVTACDLIYRALMEFKSSEDDRLVIALLGDIAASGGYYIAVAADHIVAHPTTITGSIGVIITKLNIEGLAAKYGFNLETVKSGANKDLLSPFRTLSEPQRIELQKVVDEMHERFVSLIAKGRPDLSVEDVKKIADGSIFTATRALDELKLVDQIGYWADALAKTRELLGEKELKVIRYQEPFSLSSLLSASETRGISPRSLMEAARTRVMFVWQGW